MNLKFKSLFLAGIVISLAACSDDNKDSNGSAAPKILTSEEKITNSSWCFIDNMTDEFQVVTRMNFNGTENDYGTQKSTFDYISVTPEFGPQIYLGSRQYDWKEQKNEDDYLSYNDLSVKLVEDKSEIENLTGHNQQKLIFEKILKDNKKVGTQAETFSPEMAVQVSNYNFLSTSDTVRVGYPCESFAPSFLKKEPVRPMVEFRLFLHHSIWSYSNKHEDYEGDEKFERAMDLEFPVEVNKVTPSYFENTAWCSWYQLGKFGAHVEVLTIGNGKMAKQNYIEGAEVPDMNKWWSDKAENAKVTDIESMENGIIRGAAGPNNYNLPSLYFYITDNSGAKFLARGSYTYPESSRFMFKDLFFQCSDERALEINPFFTKHLPNIIDIQHKTHGTK